MPSELTVAVENVAAACREGLMTVAVQAGLVVGRPSVGATEPRIASRSERSDRRIGDRVAP